MYAGMLLYTVKLKKIKLDWQGRGGILLKSIELPGEWVNAQTLRGMTNPPLANTPSFLLSLPFLLISFTHSLFTPDICSRLFLDPIPPQR
jgi:hypothetical protein